MTSEKETGLVLAQEVISFCVCFIRQKVVGVLLRCDRSVGCVPKLWQVLFVLAATGLPALLRRLGMLLIPVLHLYGTVGTERKCW
jgi:hypothetical protein